jgi:hypothetical protein
LKDFFGVLSVRIPGMSGESPWRCARIHWQSVRHLSSWQSMSDFPWVNCQHPYFKNNLKKGNAPLHDTLISKRFTKSISTSTRYVGTKGNSMKKSQNRLVWLCKKQLA